MREFTPLAIVLGIVIGVVMGAANAYIGLRYGLTISASIPAAVISMGIMRGILRRGTLLENNMVQTIGSAGESLAAGLIFTLPALFILAPQYPDDNLAPEGWTGYARMVGYGVLGGVLGVLMMVPMRRYLVAKQHGKLRFPEGTACAEVLKSGQKGASGVGLVFGGLFIGAVHKLIGNVLGLWQELVSVPVRTRWVDLRTNVSMQTVAALLGVGFILGLRVSAIMVAGGLLSWLAFIPAIAYFGQFINQPLAPATGLIKDMSPDGIWTNYIRYIGAGGVVFGGMVSLVKAFPTITASVFSALGQMFRPGGSEQERTDRDLPIWIVGAGSIAIILLTWLLNPDAGLTGAIIVAVAGFIFVAVAARIVGEVGSTSSPVSGMTIATLLAAGLIFSQMDLGIAEALAALIGVGSVVCIAIAIAGDCSQDLKTGYLVGATPAKQQIGEVIGVVTSAIACAGVLLLLNKSFGFVPDDPAMLAAGDTPRETLLAPQANVIALLLRGILDTNLPWELLLVGMAAALVVECLGVPSLPFAVGLYLPLYLTSPIFAGGLLHWFVAGRKNNHRGGHAGILAASGLVAGDALIGLGLAGIKFFDYDASQWLTNLSQRDGFTLLGRLMSWRDAADTPWHAWTVSLVPFAFLMLFLAFVAWRGGRKPDPDGFGTAPAEPTVPTPPRTTAPAVTHQPYQPPTTPAASVASAQPATRDPFPPQPMSQSPTAEPADLPTPAPSDAPDDLVGDWFKEDTNDVDDDDDKPIGLADDDPLPPKQGG